MMKSICHVTLGSTGFVNSCRGPYLYFVRVFQALHSHLFSKSFWFPAPHSMLVVDNSSVLPNRVFARLSDQVIQTESSAIQQR